MPENQQRKHSFLPDFCNVRTLFIVILLGELLALVLAMAHLSSAEQLITDLALYSLFIQWIALSCSAGLCLARDYLSYLSDIWVASISYLLILLLTLLVVELAWWFFLARSAVEHKNFLIQCMGISAIVSALSLRYFYVQYQWRRNTELEANARLQTLESRIRPHFFFNCMNTIASLTRIDPALAEESIEDLADLFRVSLQDINKISTVAEEIALCKRYLRIETHRFGSRLQLVWEIDDLPEAVALPALILQPLVENAIYHGVEPLSGNGIIHIKGHTTTDTMNISVTSPLADSDKAWQHEGNKMAHQNIRQRLLAHYGKKGLLEIETAAQHYTAKIIIPYSNENTDR